jgi:uncharacterized protein (TIGR00730 family)
MTDALPPSPETTEEATPAEVALRHDPQISGLVEELLDAIDARRHKDVFRDIVYASLSLVDSHATRLDLKIARSAVEEMASAFRMFARYRNVPKVTIFGSARTAPSDSLYALTRDLAHQMATWGWMVVTGAGPGIMAAGSEGAGPDMAIGINIRLPFETVPNQWIADSEKLVEMKYFFTRKLMLMKESSGFLVLPGGFGTLDEAFELLTLLQTGKAEPAPIVLVDTPGDTYWEEWERFVSTQVFDRGLADRLDSSLYFITDDVAAATGEILGFYRNYHSRRFVGDVMVMRLHRAPDEEELALLSAAFSDICSSKGIWRTEPLGPERASHDHLDLERIALEFDRAHHGRLRQLIDSLNALVANPGQGQSESVPAG